MSEETQAEQQRGVMIRDDAIAFVCVQHLENEQIVHTTNIKNAITANEYLVRILRTLADTIEQKGQVAGEEPANDRPAMLKRILRAKCQKK